MRPLEPPEDDAPREFLRDFTPSEQRDLDEHEPIVLPYTTTKNLPVAWIYDFDFAPAS